MEEITVRKMTTADIPAVLAIAEQSFSTPWSSSSFAYETANSDAVLRVAESGKGVTGYICARFFPDNVHIMDIAVAPRERRKGTGSILLSDVLREIIKTRPETGHITLEVRASNLPAIRLYKKFGFMETGRRIKYYTGPSEDGIVMDLEPGRCSHA